jgi:hypothetical protein
MAFLHQRMKWQSVLLELIIALYPKDVSTYFLVAKTFINDKKMTIYRRKQNLYR